MSAKNNLATTQNTAASVEGQVQLPVQRMPSSLRWRLVIWYGALLALALIIFGVLVLISVTDATERSMDSAVQAEVRVTNAEIRSELSGDAPYWPSKFHLN